MSELTVERRECRLYDIGPVSLEAVKVTEENIPDIKKWIREKTANDSKPALDVGE